MKLLMVTMDRIRAIDSVNFRFPFSISYDDQGMSDIETAEVKFAFLRDSILPVTKSFLTYEDKPVIFIWNYELPYPYLSADDYNTALDNVFSDNKPKVLWNQIDAPEIADSYYPWVEGWAADGSNWGKNYLDWFYLTISIIPGFDFATGGVWAGFDDRECSWGGGRWIDRRNGVIYDSTWLFANSYSGLLPLKWVYIETWNDWNEGTEIEPSVEDGYYYLESTVRNINNFKGTSLIADTCLYSAASKIYSAGNMIESGQNRDSACYYPVPQRAIKYFLLRNCEEAGERADSILNNSLLNCYITSVSTNEKDIGAFPNPVNDRLYIHVPDNTDASVFIISLEGIVIKQFKLTDRIKNISVKGIPRGNYILRLMLKEGSFEKIITIQ